MLGCYYLCGVSVSICDPLGLLPLLKKHPVRWIGFAKLPLHLNVCATLFHPASISASKPVFLERLRIHHEPEQDKPHPEE